MEMPPINASHNYYNFSKANYVEILKYLQKFNWIETLSQLDVDFATNTQYDALHHCIMHFVPVLKYMKFKFPTWFSKNLKFTILAKRQAHALFKSTSNPHYYTQFSNLQDPI
jgi:hypothetical protein